MTSKLDHIETFRPPADEAVLPANQSQLRVDFLTKVLHAYFGRSHISRKGNQIYVRTPSTVRSAKYAHFTGTVEVVFEEAMREFKHAAFPRLTFQDEKKLHLESFPIRDFDDLKHTLATYWPSQHNISDEETPQPPPQPASPQNISDEETPQPPPRHASPQNIFDKETPQPPPRHASYQRPPMIEIENTMTIFSSEGEVETLQSNA